MSNFYVQYPSSSGAANASVGTNNTTAPTSSTQIAGVNAGNLVPVSVDADGTVNVSLVDQGAGLATAAKQDTGNASLASIDGKTPALGQALAAASTPVVLTAAQISTLTPLTSVIVTQATGTNLHAVVDSSALPTGAATETTLSALSNKSASSDVHEAYDYRSFTYVGATQKIDTIVYKTGGSGGTTVATQAFGYDGSDRLTSITKS